MSHRWIVVSKTYLVKDLLKRIIFSNRGSDQEGWEYEPMIVMPFPYVIFIMRNFIKSLATKQNFLKGILEMQTLAKSLHKIFGMNSILNSTKRSKKSPKSTSKILDTA